MIYRVMEPGMAMDVDAATMTYNGEHAYVNMSKLVLMSGMVGMMLAAMLSATLSNVSGILNVYANVFTYDVWKHKDKNRNADERTLIKVGRTFTVVFGLVIIGLSMLIPFAGGAEKVVVTLLTMIMCPLYIPSIWGLFSRRLTGNQLISAMLVTWAIGITAKLAVPASVMSQSMIESISGCVLPVVILAGMELWSKAKGITDKGYEATCEFTDPHADREPDERARKSVKAYSCMAANCFCLTLLAIAVLLLGLLLTGDAKTMEVKNIVICFIAAICIIDGGYAAYRIIGHKKDEK